VVNVEMLNSDDDDSFSYGKLKFAQVRRATVSLLVDTGSTALSIPEEIIKRLGLLVVGAAESRFANGQTAVRKIYGPVTIKISGQKASIKLIPSHPGTPAFLG
jgi:predicted aspartyl protease